MSYAIRYYRDEATSRRYHEHSKLFKPVAWVLTQDRYISAAEAQKHVNHINAQRPAKPCYALPSNDMANRSTFRTMTRWV